EDRRALGCFGQFWIAQTGHVLAHHGTVNDEPDLLANFAGDDVVVTRDDLHGNTVVFERTDSFACRFFRRVEESDIPSQHEVALIGDRVGAVLRGGLPFGDRPRAQTVLVQVAGNLPHLL